MKADRASQFQPFAALKGFEEALREKERIIVEKKDLSEEALEQLDYQIKQIEVGSMVTVIYYDGEAYIQKRGMVSRINTASRYLTVVTTDISFEDLKEIRL